MSKEMEDLQRLKESIERRKPSQEKIWLKHYEDGAFERGNDIPNGMTVWDVLEEKLVEHYGIPALEYFKKETSRPDFGLSTVY